MKAIIEFNLDEIDDKYAHLRFTKSADLCYFINSLEDEIIKHSPEDIKEKYYELKSELLSDFDEYWR